ncbi:hypothetical protein QFZ51_000660 [Chitinophaga sp. W3I9]
MLLSCIIYYADKSTLNMEKLLNSNSVITSRLAENKLQETGHPRFLSII